MAEPLSVRINVDYKEWCRLVAQDRRIQTTQKDEVVNQSGTGISALNDVIYSTSPPPEDTLSVPKLIETTSIPAEVDEKLILSAIAPRNRVKAKKLLHHLKKSEFITVKADGSTYWKDQRIDGANLIQLLKQVFSTSKSPSTQWTEILEQLNLKAMIVPKKRHLKVIPPVAKQVGGKAVNTKQMKTKVANSSQPVNDGNAPSEASTSQSIPWSWWFVGRFK